MNSKELSAALVRAATRYDEQALNRSRKNPRASYNPYALSHYFARIEEVVANVEAGAEIRPAIIAGFTGSLRNAFLKAAGLPKFDPETDDESRSWVYVPAPTK